MLGDENESPTTGAACPICGRPTVRACRPFCSKRCADVDLQRWFTGRYAIPAAQDESEPDPALVEEVEESEKS